MAFENQEDGVLAKILMPDGSKDVPIRKIIAQRLLASKVGIPALYLSADVVMDELLGLRKALAARDIKVSVNDFVLKAVAQALKEVPAANVYYHEANGDSQPFKTVDICVAVATDKGLITPIVKGADGKTLTQISAEVKQLAAKAKANKLKPEEFQGGSFTVSNLGMYGVTAFSAIINPPQ
ncbi:dihydrolipoamide acetyltransferase component of pyruvate dehydrogenase complex, partial [Haematococcus lacustris]